MKKILIIKPSSLGDVLHAFPAVAALASSCGKENCRTSWLIHPAFSDLLDYLPFVEKKIFFERMFQTVLSAGELARLEAIANLAPGDFRTVRQALYYLDDDSNAARLTALEKESAAKPAALTETKNSIGF